MLLTDDQWEIINQNIPALIGGTNIRYTSPQRERYILECILWKLAMGIPWFEFPEAFPFSSTNTRHPQWENHNPPPSHRVIYRRYRKWRKTDLLVKVFSYLASDLKTRGSFDLSSTQSDGLIKFEVNHRNKWKITTHPDHRKSWQVTTALLLISIAARQR